MHFLKIKVHYKHVANRGLTFKFLWYKACKEWDKVL